MSIIDEYIEFDKKYKTTYGKETVILMEVGDFFEMYGVQNDFEIVGANLQEISDILNIRVTLKNKSNANIDRKNPMMSAVAGALEKQDMHDLAAYFAAQKQARTGFKAEPERIKAGAAKAEESLCAMCHMGGMTGQNEIPRLAGQHPEYIMSQLKNFKARERTNDAGNMTSLAQTLSEEDMTNLSHWISSLY